MALLYVPSGLNGIIGNMPSGSIYKVESEGTITVDANDVATLLLRGFTVAASATSATIEVISGTVDLTGISTLDFLSGAVVSLGSTGVANITISGGTATVSNVGVSGGTTGLSTTGGPITSDGTITLGGTLAAGSGGTGLTSLAGLLALQAANSVAITGGSITGMPTPSAATDVAIKSYVDAAIQGLQVKPTATVATAAALAANTYNNGTAGAGATITLNATGTLTIDGYLTVLGDVILVKNEVTSANNGLYTVTTAGAGGVAAVLTRHVDMNTAAEVPGAFIPVGNLGSANANSLWLANPSTPYVIGTTALPFTQLNGATSLSAGSNINIAGNTISVNGTLGLNVGGIGIVSGTSGGILAFTSGSVLASSGALAANGIMIGGGAGVAPTAVTAMTNGQLLIGATGAAPAPQTISGDITINSGGVATLGSVVPAGTIGSSSLVPVIVFDAKGRITSATSVAVSTGATVGGLGAVINSGSVQINNVITATGTAGGTLTIAPGTGTSDVIINMPAAGGTVSVTGSPTFTRQRMLWDIKQGATFGVLNLGSIYNMTGAVTSFTLTPTNNAIDRIEWFSPNGTVWVPLAVNQGATI